MKTLAQIAAELQGYDPQALPAEDVSRFLAKLVAPVIDASDVPLFEALGRVLAADVVSPFDVPPHDNSAMDGYAFDGQQLNNAPLTLQVMGTAFAGKAWQGGVQAGAFTAMVRGPKGSISKPTAPRSAAMRSHSTSSDTTGSTASHWGSCAGRDQVGDVEIPDAVAGSVAWKLCGTSKNERTDETIASV